MQQMLENRRLEFSDLPSLPFENYTSRELLLTSRCL